MTTPWSPVLLSLELAAWTTLILFAVGGGLAWWLAHTRSRIKPLVEALTALPLVLPPTVLGFYLLVLMGRDGPLGGLWTSLGETPAFRFSGLLLASCLYSLPFVVQPLQGALERMDARMADVARTLGASEWGILFRVVLPQIRRGILTAGVLGFVHTLGEFGVVLMVGGNIPGRTQVISIAIYERVELLDYATAHRLSALLLAASFVTLWLIYLLNGQRRMGVAP